MAMGRRAHVGLARLGSRAWIVVLAVALAGAAVAEVFCHEEHAADQDCAVCLLRHQPAAEPSGSPHIGFADASEPVEQAGDSGWVAAVHSRRLPARGPPA